MPKLPFAKAVHNIRREAESRFAVSPAGSALNRLRRGLRSQHKAKGGNSIHLKPIPGLRRGIYQAALLGMIALVALLFGWTGSLVNSIQLRSSSIAGANTAAGYVGANIDVMLLVYQSTDRYNFVDYLGVISFDPSQGETRLISIDPDMTSNAISGRVGRNRYTAGLPERSCRFAARPEHRPLPGDRTWRAG
jgi:hypothetical protein